MASLIYYVRRLGARRPSHLGYGGVWGTSLSVRLHIPHSEQPHLCSGQAAASNVVFVVFNSVFLRVCGNMRVQLNRLLTRLHGFFGLFCFVRLCVRAPHGGGRPVLVFKNGRKLLSRTVGRATHICACGLGSKVKVISRDIFDMSLEPRWVSGMTSSLWPVQPLPLVMPFVLGSTSPD